MALGQKQTESFAAATQLFAIKAVMSLRHIRCSNNKTPANQGFAGVLNITVRKMRGDYAADSNASNGEPGIPGFGKVAGLLAISFGNLALTRSRRATSFC